MGLFDSLFGRSWADRVAVFMCDQRYPLPERIRSCINTLTPKADPGDIAQGLPVSEIRKHLHGLPDAEELATLAAAMHLRKSMRIPIVAMKERTEAKCQLTMISDRPRLPTNDDNRYRRFENESLIIWNPVDKDGKDLAPCPR